MGRRTGQVPLPAVTQRAGTSRYVPACGVTSIERNSGEIPLSRVIGRPVVSAVSNPASHTRFTGRYRTPTRLSLAAQALPFDTNSFAQCPLGGIVFRADGIALCISSPKSSSVGSNDGSAKLRAAHPSAAGTDRNMRRKPSWSCIRRPMPNFRFPPGRASMMSLSVRAPSASEPRLRRLSALASLDGSRVHRLRRGSTRSVS